jgi:hypothetical protein
VASALRTASAAASDLRVLPGRYLGQGLIATLAGLAATAWGLQDAVVVFSIVLAALSVVVTAVGRGPSAWRTARTAVARR